MVATRKTKNRIVVPDESEEIDASDDEPALLDKGNELLSGIVRLQHRIKSLKNENERLQEQIDGLKAHTQPKVRSKTWQLEERIRKLESTEKKHRKIIHSYKKKEMEAEADNLNGANETFTEDDTPHAMRKLLRRFSDLMVQNTLGEGEECPVCFDELVVKKCSSLCCEHTICDKCLAKVSNGAKETVMCPLCRAACSRDEVESIHFTEVERWDALLKVAEAWSAFDKRGEMETSDEKQEENFLDDEDSESEDAEVDTIASEPSVRSVTPPPNPVSYSESPTKGKRKMLEKLARERENRKKSRH